MTGSAQRVMDACRQMIESDGPRDILDMFAHGTGFGAAARQLGAARAAADQIGQLIARHDNAADPDRNWAVTAAGEGRAAYWRTTQYHNATVALVCNEANLTNLASALGRWMDPHHPGKTATAILSRLVPLNVTAEVELRDAKHAALWAEAETTNVEHAR